MTRFTNSHQIMASLIKISNFEFYITKKDLK